MKSFQDFLGKYLFLEEKEQIIKLGGNAFKNVSPIQLNDIFKTINDFIKLILTPTYQIVSIDNNTLFTLGSTGKKPQSGDIDLCINANMIHEKPKMILQKIYSYTKLYTDIEVILNEFSNEMVQFAFPIHKNLENKLVQIDLIITNYPTFIKWYEQSPLPNQSKYKAAQRNELYNAIAKTLTYKPIKTINKEVVTWQQECITSDGVYLQLKTIVDENNKRLYYKDTDELLLPKYAQIIKQIPITHSPLKTVQRYLGNYNPKSLISFEQVLKIIQNPSYKFKEDVDDILNTAANDIQSDSRLILPEELEKYL